MMLLLVLLIVGVSGYDGESKDSFGCPAVFKGRCRCGPGRYPYWDPTKDLYIVNCTNTGFESTEMLELLPNGTEVLIFTGNHLADLDWNILGVWDSHEALLVIDMSNNKIQEIPGKAFHRVQNVRKLILNHNNLVISGSKSHPRIFTNFRNLEELHLTNAFTETLDSCYYLDDLKDIFLTSNMTKLRTISLDQNEIWQIRNEDMFCDLPSLTHLNLRDNQLQRIDFSLDCLKQLRYLDLEYNKIKNLDNKTLQKLERAFGGPNQGDRRINLKENPFRCDCHFSNFFNWLLTTNITFIHKEDLRCYDGWPASNAGKRIVNVQKLKCPPRPSAKNETQSVGTSMTHALLVILILLVAGLLTTVIYLNRVRIKENFSPLVENFQKSMQYKTIDKEESMPPEVNV